ncbi:hypothetical protein BN873_360022 [Candidatus Competibacter denitrificans Run_A_D11]|uniref:Uncharacterized protein n=1 Tax=Candidatus Competibacter denitrificans Run_A_D11 TaxID=1400863 RepID=W6MDI6_9GAMM|nr:hypothetical protein BN873_360022 [Candidatus Competibacter denitrificans Run_A_D11]
MTWPMRARNRSYPWLLPLNYRLKD